MTHRRGKRLIRASLVFISLITAWYAIELFSASVAHLFPPPQAVASALWHLVVTSLLGDLAATFSRILVGFTIALICARWIGLRTGTSARWRDSLEPLFQTLRPVPALALIPVAIVWFGTGELEKYFVIAWAAFFPIWVGTHAAAQDVPRELIWTAQTLGATGNRIRSAVVAPSAAPAVFAATRTGLGLAFAAAVVAEIIGSSEGLGYRIIEGNQAYQYGSMLAAVIAVGLVGALTDWAYTMVFRPERPENRLSERQVTSSK
jgi:ABC-type nitrate/sulfonate/bicarbonate transport system permease component